MQDASGSSDRTDFRRAAHGARANCASRQAVIGAAQFAQKRALAGAAVPQALQ